MAVVSKIPNDPLGQRQKGAPNNCDDADPTDDSDTDDSDTDDSDTDDSDTDDSDTDDSDTDDSDTDDSDTDDSDTDDSDTDDSDTDDSDTDDSDTDDSDTDDSDTDDSDTDDSDTDDSDTDAEQDNGWEMTEGLIHNGFDSEFLSDWNVAGPWNSGTGNPTSTDYWSMNGTYQGRGLNRQTSFASFTLEYNGSDWDDTQITGVDNASATSNTSTGNGSFSRKDDDGVVVSGAMGSSSGFSTGNVLTIGYESYNGQVSKDEYHSANKRGIGLPKNV